MKVNTLPKKTTLLWQIRIILVSLLVAILCYYFSAFWGILNIAAIVIAVLGVLTSLIYLPFFFKSFKIVLTNEAVVVKFGILIKMEHIMPYKRMIYAQTFETPLARIFGIAAVRLKAARSYLLVPEIEKDSAKAIMDFLAEGERNE